MDYPGGDLRSEISFSGLAAGTYYVFVDYWNGIVGPYELLATVTPL